MRTVTDRVKADILLVDDQPGKLLSLEAVLADLDENILKATCADEALKLLLERDIAVVLVDVCMPEMDGFELAELIRQHPRFNRTAIIFISAVHLSDDDRLRGYGLGAVDYIPVPIIPEVLRAKVTIFTELHRKTEQLYRLNQQLEQRVAERTADLESSAARLRESQKRYQRLIQALPAAVYTCDAQGRVTLFNQAAVDLWGRTPVLGDESWCGSFRIFRFDGTPLPPEECPMAIALRTGRIVRGVEFVIERPDGTRRTVVPHPELLHDEAGNIVGAINMLSDVTDSRNAEQAQALLAEIVASSEDAIISTTLDGQITSWNSGAERVFGYKSAEVLGQSIQTLIPPDRASEEADIIERLRQGDRIQSFETLRVASDGRCVSVSLTVSPVRDRYGQMVGVSKVARDIGERKRAEAVLARDRETLERLVAERTRELEISAKRLRIADRMATIGTLSAGLGHDMGNLLLPIRMRLDAIEGGVIPPEVREDVVAIRKATEYLQRLAASLRLLALDPESESAFAGSTDLSQWWFEAEGMIRNGIPRTVTLKYAAPPDLPPIMVGKAALTQMIFNLVQNAGDALKSRPSGQVTVAAEADHAAQRVLITVTDNGPGMSEEARLRCLEPFFTTKTRGMSTGLGLALVSGLVSKVGGTITIDTAPGEGTRITLSLKIAERGPTVSVREGQLRSVAVVTLSDPRMTAHVRSVLRSLEFEISEAGLEHADLWVTEASGEDGLVAANQFVRAGPVRRALVFTGETARANQDGRVVILETPMAPSVLRSRIHGLLAAQP